jgi:gliding motility-associated-like protein
MKHIILFVLCLAGHHLFALNEGNALRFIENKGQWDKSVRFKIDIPSGSIFLKNNGLHYIFRDDEAIYKLKHSVTKENPNTRKVDTQIAMHSLMVTFVGANQNPEMIGKNKSEEKYNFFLSNNPNDWATGVSAYGEVLYKNVYDGVDLRIFCHQNSLKYEFILQAGVSPSNIKLRYSGADALTIESGHLHVKTSLAEVIEMKPYCFQENKNTRKNTEIEGQFSLKNNELTYDFPKGFDPNQPLVIDPKLVFSTYSGSTADNWGHTATYDAEGHLYAGGSVNRGTGTSPGQLPTTTGAFQTSFGGGWDVAIHKYSSDGTKLLYGSYLGGSFSDIPHSLICNSKGELLVFGTTSSPNFPVSKDAYDQSFDSGQNIAGSTGQPFQFGSDIFVTKISKDGTQILGSTYVGGSNNDGLNLTNSVFTLRNYGDEFRGEIITDDQDNVFIASTSTSTDFPLVNPAKSSISGSYDGVIFQLNPNLSKLLWSTYVGGNGFDALYSLKIGKNKAVYACGGTRSSNLPATGLKKTLTGSEDGFVVKFENQRLTATTYLGTDAADLASLLDLDPAENVVIFGLTNGTYPTTNGVFSNARSGQFIHALGNNLSTTAYSTVIGGGTGRPEIVPTAFLVNKCGKIYLAGWGGKVNDELLFPFQQTMAGMPVTTEGYRTTSDGSNFYIAMLEAGAKSLLYGTFIGGNHPRASASAGDHVDGGTCRFDKNGVIYHSTCSCNRSGAASNFPTTAGAWSSTNLASNCNMSAFKFDVDNFSVAFSATGNGLTSPSSSPDTLVGCVPFALNFNNLSADTKTLEWNIANLKTTINANSESYTFEKEGLYTVTLKGTNPLTCDGEKSAKKVIKVTAFDPKVSDAIKECIGRKIQLKAEGGDTYQWSPVEGLDNPKSPTPSLTVSKAQTFSVEIVKGACKSTKQVNVAIDDSFAKISRDTTICEGGRALLQASGGTSYVWTLAEGISDTTKPNQSINISKSGTYTVKIFDSATGCRAQRSVNVTLDRSYNPSFDIKKTTGCGKATLVELSNNSRNADGYVWALGWGDTLRVANPSPLDVQVSGKYDVTLIATKKGCKALTLSKPIEVESFGSVPNIITPNEDGKNDTFVVGGKLQNIQIYDRWGSKLLETNDYKNDWGKGIKNGVYYFIFTTQLGQECKGWIEVLE